MDRFSRFPDYDGLPKSIQRIKSPEHLPLCDIPKTKNWKINIDESTEIHSRLDLLEYRIQKIEKIIYENNTISFKPIFDKEALNEMCLEFFFQKTEPKYSELHELAKGLRKRMPEIENKIIISQIRKWFRKKRDETAQKIYKVCQKDLLEKYGKEDLKSIIDNLENHHDVIELLLDRANIEIKNPNSAYEFCELKLKSFSKRHLKSQT